MCKAVSRAVGWTGMTVAVVGCGLFGGGRANDEFAPQRRTEIMLEVRNQNFYDATLYAVARGERLRIGFISGNSSETFSFRWTQLDLSIEVDFLAVGSFFTESIPVDRGDVLELIIEPDAHRRAIRR